MTWPEGAVVVCLHPLTGKQIGTSSSPGPFRTKNHLLTDVMVEQGSLLVSRTVTECLLSMRSDCYTKEPGNLELWSGCRFGTP